MKYPTGELLSRIEQPNRAPQWLVISENLALMMSTDSLEFYIDNAYFPVGWYPIGDV